jgi:hypothetical protein
MPRRAGASAPARNALSVTSWSGSGSAASLQLGASAFDRGRPVSPPYLARHPYRTQLARSPAPDPCARKPLHEYVSEMGGWVENHPSAALIVASSCAWRGKVSGEPHASGDHLLLGFLFARQTATCDWHPRGARERESAVWDAHGIFDKLAGTLRENIPNLRPEICHMFRWYDRRVPNGPDSRQLRIDDRGITLIDGESEILLAHRGRGTNVGGRRSGLFALKDAAQGNELLTWGRVLTRIDIHPAKEKTANWCGLPVPVATLTPPVFEQLLECLDLTGATGSTHARAMMDKIIYELCSGEGPSLPRVSERDRERAREAIFFAYQRGAVLHDALR